MNKKRKAVWLSDSELQTERHCILPLLMHCITAYTFNSAINVSMRMQFFEVFFCCLPFYRIRIDIILLEIDLRDGTRLSMFVVEEQK